MALAPRLSNAGANAAADAVLALLDGGKLRLYDGTQPTDADTPITTQQLLAELTFNTPAFAAAVDGIAAANPITADPSAPGSGTATWFRAVTAGGATVFDGSVGTSSANVILNSTAISAGASVALSAFSYTQRKT